MGFVQHHDVVEALAAERADETFHVRILPRRSRRRLDFADPHAFHSARELDAVDPVAVAQEVSRGSLPGERLHELLGRPLGGGGVGDVEVDDASPIMRQDHEDEQHLEHHRGHGEEVDGDEAPQVVVEKRSPGLRWRPPKAAPRTWTPSPARSRCPASGAPRESAARPRLSLVHVKRFVSADAVAGVASSTRDGTGRHRGLGVAT